MLCLFLVFISVFQLSRIGLLDNSEHFTNAETGEYTTVANNTVLSNTHQLGKIALIYDETAVDRLYVYENFESILSKYSIAFDTIDAADNYDLTGYDMLIVIIGNYENARILQDVFNFIEAGGTAYFPVVPVDSDSFRSVMGMMGIIEKSYFGECKDIIDVKGLLGEKGKTYYFDTPLQIRYFVLRLRSDCDIYFEDSDGNPLLWKRPLGEGSIYMCNADYLSSYSSRGVISQILYEVLKQEKSQAFIYPLYMVSTQVLQEFPSANKLSDSKLLTEEGLTYDTFIEDRLWPLISEMNERYGAKTTAAFVMSYDENTEGDFNKSLLSNSSIKSYSIEVLRKGGEIAYHGYSYRPLGLKGELNNLGWFIPWKDMDTIEESLDLANDNFTSLFPNYELRVYIPPQGRVSSNVISNLKRMQPNVEVIVSPYERMYYDQINKDFERGSDGFFYYSMTTDINGMVWNTVNSLVSLGISSFSVDANQMLLDEVLTWDKFEALITDSYEIIDGYTGLENMTVSEACAKIECVNNADYSYTETDTAIELRIDGWYSGMAFALRYEGALSDGNGYSLEKYMDGYYIVRPESENITIRK